MNFLLVGGAYSIGEIPEATRSTNSRDVPYVAAIFARSTHPLLHKQITSWSYDWVSAVLSTNVALSASFALMW